MTPFDVALENFVKFADRVDPRFGQGARDIIATQYVSQLAGVEPTTPAAKVTNALSDFVDSIRGVYINTATAWYQTKAQLADLKTQAKGSPVTQLVNAVTPAPASWILWAGLGLAALLIMRPTGK